VTLSVGLLVVRRCGVESCLDSAKMDALHLFDHGLTSFSLGEVVIGKSEIFPLEHRWALPHHLIS